MPATRSIFSIENPTQPPDILPAYGQGGKTWNDTTQASRCRLNVLGDRDGSAIFQKTVNISTGYTGNVLIAQLVGVQSITPRYFTGSGNLYLRMPMYGVASVTTVNATATNSIYFTDGVGAALQAGTNVNSGTGTAFNVTTATSRFLVDSNLVGSIAKISSAGYLVVEIGVSIAASTTAGTVSIWLGSAPSALIPENTTTTGGSTTTSPWGYFDPDLFNVDNANYRTPRAEGNLSANIGW